MSFFQYNKLKELSGGIQEVQDFAQLAESNRNINIRYISEIDGALYYFDETTNSWKSTGGAGGNISGKEDKANKGVANGYASLDGSAKVPASQLPSYVDDVLEFANLAAFPATGETGKIYVALSTNKTYRWSGSTYIEIGAAASIMTGANGTVAGAAGLVPQPLANKNNSALFGDAKFKLVEKKATIFLGKNDPDADVNTADFAADHLALKAAIDLADNSTTCRTVRIGAGTFEHSADLGCTTPDKYSNLVIEGAGMDVTTLKAIAGCSIFQFGTGDATLGKVWKNITIRNLTIDMNNIPANNTYGMAFGCCQDVTLENIKVKNQKNGALSMLFFGITDGASSDFLARNLTVNNCTFENSDSAWESVTLAQMKNAKFTNCNFRNKSTLYSFLNYNSYDVSVVGCHFENCQNGANGHGSTLFVGCTFKSAWITIQADNTVFQGCHFYNLPTERLSKPCKIRYIGYKTVAEELAWDEPGVGVIIKLKGNKVIGCNFQNCNQFGIEAGVWEDVIRDKTNPEIIISKTPYMSCEDLTITDCVIEDSLFRGALLVANVLTLRNITFRDNNRFNSGEAYNLSVNGTHVFVDNIKSTKVNNAGSIAYDILIDRQPNYVTVIPTCNLYVRNSVLQSGGIAAWNGAGLTQNFSNLGINLHLSQNIGLSTTANTNLTYIYTNSGTATIASGNTSIVVNHNLSAAPDIKDIIVTRTNSGGNSTKFWISNITSTTFTINVDIDPGATTAIFAWKINR